MIQVEGNKLSNERQRLKIILMKVENCLIWVVVFFNDDYLTLAS